MMPPRPEVRYATTADGIQIAYQIWGEGPMDIVIVPGLTSNVDLNPDYPFYGGYLRRFPSFARVIVLDRRGGGISDREVGSGSAEDRMDDVRAVMDAVGCERAALLGHSEGGAIGILFAATYPERVAALVLIETGVAGLSEEYYAVSERTLSTFTAEWGKGVISASNSVDALDEAVARTALGVLERSIGTPKAAARQLEFAFSLNVRPALSLVNVPTLVMHSPHTVFPEAWTRNTAEQIRGSRFIVMPGFGSWDTVKQDAFCDEIQTFLTGQRPKVGDIDRVLATVLFADIVGSTRRATELGDHRWRALLDTHDARLAADVERFRGRVVKRMGDGMLAMFDGPARAIRCARAVIEAARSLGLDVRCGLHAGEIELRGEDVSGLAVHIGARVSALANAGEVLVSSTVRDLVVGSGIEFDDRGERELRGIEGRWRVLALRM